MQSLGAAIRQHRQQLGLSTRDLARLTGVAYPTISRVENGHEQPRWDTLERLAAGLGKTLMPTFEDATFPQLTELNHCYTTNVAGDIEPDWTHIRGFADALTRRPTLTAAAISTPPETSGQPFIDNLLAAIAEKLADEAEIQRPTWTKTVLPLTTPWSAPGTPRMQAANQAATPPQFASRNITLPAKAIWRDYQPVST